MPSHPSLHDNFLLSYTVETEARRVTLRTAFLDHEPHEYTTVIFMGVLAYHLEGDTFSTVLFDIEEVSASDVYAAFDALFTRRKGLGWPALEYSTVEDFAAAIGDRGIKSFLISSSCGLDGFVMAEGLQVIPT